MEHVAAYIIYIRTFYRTRTAYYNIIGRVNTVTAGTMSTQQIVPAILIHQGAGLTVDSDILLYVALHTLTGLRVELNEADITKVGTIGSPQATRGRIQQQTGVNGIAVFHTVRRCHLNSC